MAGSVLCLIGGGLVAISGAPAGADTVGVALDYTCTDGVGKGTRLRATITAPTTMTVGQEIDVKWDLRYRDQTAFTSPGYLAAGSKLSGKGRLNIKGPWTGNDAAEGSIDQPELRVGDPLRLPSLVTGAVGATKEGEISISPRNLVVDFTPAAGEKIVNDDEAGITYSGPEWGDYNDRPLSFNDVGRDVHATTKGGATVELKFAGTGVDFITERDYRGGNLEFKIDGQPGVPVTADPSKNDDGTDVNVVNAGGYTIWKMRNLPYKADHTLLVTNLEDNSWAFVDAFKVVTRELKNPPAEFRSVCTPDTPNVAFKITVGSGGGVTQSPDPTVSTPGPSGPGPTTPGPTNTGPTTPGPSNTGNGNGNQNGNGATSTSTSTATATASPRPTNTRTVTATATPQVEITPVGAPQTGEGPTPPSGGPLIGVGVAMLTGGVLGGLLLHRRRAAHVAGGGR
ncbi:hypothetical protein [Spongiactinospora sp. TRM90649]|uniref:hypothetical protein n=1 Tax=Spongiactinospora sp. TRM90649 TaxID=3031114 RepID=UPI0023F70D66|nr:hypothetical protein [Spongiactinospora sp. TRM90649]MDF5751588.1 hypothetical protein [Spongiactinospora sp. TRM90649]